MRHLSVALIFWLTIWTVPKAAPAWPWRWMILAWGLILCWQMLRKHGGKDE
jgi:hypothetical protein